MTALTAQREPEWYNFSDGKRVRSDRKLRGENNAELTCRFAMSEGLMRQAYLGIAKELGNQSQRHIKCNTWSLFECELSARSNY